MTVAARAAVAALVVVLLAGLALVPRDEPPATSPARPEVASGAPLLGPASAAAPARRVAVAATGECERIAVRTARDHPHATSMVVVRSSSWTATTAALAVATLGPSGWTCGPGRDARIGRAGFRWLRERRSGDGTTPAGVFPLATMTAWDGQRFSSFGNDADPGVTAGAYRRVRPGDCFGATPGHLGYGHLREDRACAGADDEYLPDFTGSYAHAALIGANTEPAVSGDEPGEIPYAAAIFLHRHSLDAAGRSRSTSGCVSLALADLVDVLVGLRADTLFVMGPTTALLGEG